MKDKIIVKKRKHYLASWYNRCNWSFHLMLIIIAVMFISATMVWIDSPVDSQDSYYLKINDAGEDVLGYYVVGDLYRLESLKNGGMHPTGEERIIVPISDFIYRQIEEGNLISLVEDGNGNYQYDGNIYPSISSMLPSPFYSEDDFPSIGIFLLPILGAVIGLGLIYYSILDARSSSRIITIDGFNSCYKEDRWYGTYVYGRAKVDGSDSYEMIRIKDGWMFLNLDIDGGDSMYKEGNRFYTLKWRFRRVKNIDEHIEKLMEVEATQ